MTKNYLAVVGMRWSTLTIVCIWAATYIPFTLKLVSLPARNCLTQFPAHFALVFILLPMVLFPLAAFINNQSPWYGQKLARFIDTFAGEGGYESFLIRFRPLLFFGLGGLLEGLYHVWWCDEAGVQISVQSKGWFFVAGGLGFILAHVVLKLRKAQAVGVDGPGN